jgi:hypothetical protein
VQEVINSEDVNGVGSFAWRGSRERCMTLFTRIKSDVTMDWLNGNDITKSDRNEEASGTHKTKVITRKISSSWKMFSS